MNIKEYLSKVMQLEMSLYEQKKIINDLCTKRKNIADNPGYKARKEYEYFQKEPLSMPIIISGVVIFSLIMVIIFLRDCFKDPSSIFLLPLDILGALVFGCLIGIPSGAIIGAVMSFCINRPINKKEWERVERANDDIYDYNKQIDNYNNQCVNTAKTKISIINKEIEMLENNARRTQSALRTLYDLNIIYPKYRYMVAIFTFYEYFDSERCSKLEGHEGAYNIFENEIKFGIIFEKLDVIVQKLNEISQGQYELRNAIYESNSRISGIVNEVGLISNQLKDISNSVKLTEYNAYRSKECAEALAWVKSYELLSSKSF